MSRIAARPRAGARAGAGRTGHGWQLILADLALILFLLTLSALPPAEAETGRQLAARAAQEKAAREEDARPRPEIAAAQALYRPVAGGPSLGAWLKAQAPDPRATLTIFSVHAPGEEAEAWARAEALAAEARGAGARVRTIIATGTEAEIYASLAYDAQPAEALAAR